MEIHRLVAMANQIGAFFESNPDPDEAARAVAQHLKSFWVPAMRRELVAYRREGGADLKEVVCKALLIIEGEQPSERSPA